MIKLLEPMKWISSDESIAMYTILLLLFWNKLRLGVKIADHEGKFRKLDFIVSVNFDDGFL